MLTETRIDYQQKVRITEIKNMASKRVLLSSINNIYHSKDSANILILTHMPYVILIAAAFKHLSNP